jgi:hypothetical protein
LALVRIFSAALDAFWSLTLYDAFNFCLVANPSSHRAIGTPDA